MLAKTFPAFADYRVYNAQPSFWLETLQNFLKAQSEYENQRNG